MGILSNLNYSVRDNGSYEEHEREMINYSKLFKTDLLHIRNGYFAHYQSGCTRNLPIGIHRSMLYEK